HLVVDRHQGDLQVGLPRRIDCQPAAFRTHLGIGIHFEPELVDIKIVGARLVQHEDRKMVRFSYHYFLQTSSKIVMLEEYREVNRRASRKLLCSFARCKKTALLFKEGWRGEAMKGGYCFVRTGSIAAGQVARTSVHDMLLFVLFRVVRG